MFETYMSGVFDTTNSTKWVGMYNTWKFPHDGGRSGLREVLGHGSEVVNGFKNTYNLRLISVTMLLIFSTCACTMISVYLGSYGNSSVTCDTPGRVHKSSTTAIGTNNLKLSLGIFVLIHTCITSFKVSEFKHFSPITY